jgi:hypothetical protein
MKHTAKPDISVITPELRREFSERLKTEQCQADLKRAAARVNEATERLRRDLRVDPKLMREPITR